jgi:uncharacterized protein
MSSAFATTEVEFTMPLVTPLALIPAESLCVEALTKGKEEEVLNFLSRRPIHTVCMSGYIRDHGIVSPLNRGIFYGCRNRKGELEGVALIGHATLLETQNNEALKAFAQLKDQYATSHLLRGEHEMISRFWDHFAELGRAPRLACREMLFEQKSTPKLDSAIPNLRPATLEDLTSVININAQMILSECGINPLVKDPAGFRERVTRRIKHGRVWVWSKRGRMIFKADIFAETPEMIYLEGVNIHPLERGKGYGLRCMVQLSGILLERSRAICLLVNAQQKEITNFYRKAGYEFRGTYDTLYFSPPSH